MKIQFFNKAIGKYCMYDIYYSIYLFVQSSHILQHYFGFLYENTRVRYDEIIQC